MNYCPLCAAPLVVRDQGGRERLACQTAECGFVHWDNPLPVVAAIIEYLDGPDDGGRILLARNAAWSVEFYAVITGFLERGESPEEAVAREVKEETNLDTESVALIGVYPFSRKNELIIAYHVRARGQIVLNEELSAYKLVPLAELVPWDGGTGLALRDWMKGRGLPV